MRILAFDTSFDACSAAIVADGKPVFARTQVIGRGHSEVLPVMVDGALKACGLKVADLDIVGVVRGPGAFAGVRVGLAFARGLQLGGRLRAVGVTSLEALAASVGASEPIASVFDARRGQVYAALYDGDLRTLIAPFVATPEDAALRLRAALNAPPNAPLIIAGSGAALVAPFIGEIKAIAGEALIDPAAVARLASRAPQSEAPPSPLYLRPPDAKPSAPTGLAGARANAVDG